MWVTICVINKIEYLSYNDLRKLKDFPNKRKPISKSLDTLNYTGNIEKVLYTSKKRDTLYFPEHELEGNRKTITLIEKVKIYKLLEDYFNKNFEKTEYEKVKIINNREKSYLTKNLCITE